MYKELSPYKTSFKTFKVIAFLEIQDVMFAALARNSLKLLAVLIDVVHASSLLQNGLLCDWTTQCFLFRLHQVAEKRGVSKRIKGAK